MNSARNVLGLCFAVATVIVAADNMPFSQIPPGNMPIDSVPMFVTIGWDDNTYSDGLNWIEQFLKDKKNQGGLPARNTFYLIGDACVDSTLNADAYQSTADVINAWKGLYADGHELGNHTYSHPEGEAYTQAQWSSEMTQCDNILETKVGVPLDSITGFRTPYLEYGTGTFAAIGARPFLFDCSIEFGYNGWTPIIPPDSGYWNGMSSESTWKKLFWPYTLNNGIPPGTSSLGLPTAAGTLPTVWEFMVYTLKKTDSSGVITGMDYNCFASGNMTGPQYLATLMYNFHLRYAGNKCPFTVCCHTDNYSDWNTSAISAYQNSTVATRRLAVENFIDSVLQYPDVRMITYRNIINWLRNPVPYTRLTASGTAAHAPKMSAPARRLRVISSTPKELVLDIPDQGTYRVALFGIDGRTAFSRDVAFGQGRQTVRFDKSISEGPGFVTIREYNAVFGARIFIHSSQK